MKISWLPAGDNELAASRLRCYYPHQYINRFFNDRGYSSTLEIDSTSDILIVQKMVDKPTIDKVLMFKGIVVLDLIDDVYSHESFDPIIKKCKLILTNNVNRRQQLLDKGYKTDCVIWEDGLDYDINRIELPLNNNKNNTVWFGSTLKNFESVKPYFEILKDSPKISLNVITKMYPDAWKDQSIYHFNYFKWELDTFIPLLKQFNISLLSHMGEESKYKSNNKLLTSLALGIPAIVNYSFSYEVLLTKFGLQEYILHNPEDLKERLNSLLRYDQKIEYLKEIQPYILYRYNMYETTLQLLRRLKQL